MQDTKFSKILEKSDLGKELLSNIEIMREEIAPILEKITDLFTEYTKHDIEHSDKVIKLLDMLISDNLKSNLKEYNLYFLLCAAILHDIGMTIFDEEFEEEEVLKLKNNPEELKEYIRDNHHVRSEKFIIRNYKNLHIQNEHQAYIIGKICRGHRKEDLSQYDIDYKYLESTINMPLLAAFLRIADELDITFERIPLIDGNIVLPHNEVSCDYWKNHLSISGVSLSEEDPLLIKCSARCEDPKIHRTLRRLESKINHQIEELPQYIRYYINWIKDIPRKFIMMIEPIGYKPYDFKFSLEGKQMLTLLKGNKIYRTDDFALREALKNAIDACRYKIQLYKEQERDYNPKIKVKLSEDKNEITIEDNGIGMNFEIIDNFFTKIGNSFYNQKCIHKGEFNFTPLSELGIGVLSYFLISDKIILNTKMENCEALRLEFDNSFDFFIVYDSDRRDPGMELKFILKDEIKDLIGYSSPSALDLPFKMGRFHFEKLYLYETLNMFASHIDIPIEVSFEDRSNTISFKQYGYDFKSLNLDQYYTHFYEINEDYLEGVFLFIVSKDLTSQDYPTSIYYGARLLEVSPIFEKLGFEKPVYNISYEGIYIGYFDIFLPIILNPSYLVYDLNFKNKSVNLNLSRDLIIYDNKYFRIIELLSKNLLDELKEFISNIKRELIENNKNFKEFLYIFFVNILGPLELSIQKLKIDNQITEILNEFCFVKKIESSEITYKKYEEMIEDITEDYRSSRLFTIRKHYNNDYISSKIQKWQNYDPILNYYFIPYSLADYIISLNYPVEILKFESL